MNKVRLSVEPRASPYFGLDYYEEKFGAWFFGRETESAKIIANLRAARLTLLHAESGVGKTSLLRAGVAWRMRRLADESLARRGTARFVPVVFSSWKDDPVPELMSAVRRAIRPYLVGRPDPGLPTDRLDAAIEAASGAANASLLIMLDQFEEYFLYCSREHTPERFADELGRCINRTNLRANFLIAVREDAYAALGDLFKGRIPNIYSNYLHVEYLDRASAEQAIREPLEIYNSQPDVAEGIKIQDGLVHAVLDQVRAFDGGGDGDAGHGRAATGNGGGDRVATPLLQLVMETIWERERAAGSHELRLSTLQDLRGVRMIVDAHLSKALSALGGSGHETALDMFNHLVTPSGRKIAESVPDLAQRTGHSEAQVGSILDKLDHERIVRPIPAPPGQDPMRHRRYEIFHDVLTPSINRAIAAGEERRRSRRFRRLAALAVAFLIAALTVVIVFAILLNSADAEKLTAESRQLAAEADLNATRDPELSTLLALQALRLQHTRQAETALRYALPQVQSVRTFRIGTPASWAVFDPVNQNEVVSAGKDGAASIWDVKTGRHLGDLKPKFGLAHYSASSVAFNPAGTRIAVGYSIGKVVVFDARDGTELRSISVYGKVYDAQFIGSEGALAIATQYGIRVWRSGKELRVLSRDLTYTIAVNPEAAHQFAATTEKGTVIWGPHGNPRHLGLGDLDAEFSPNGKEVVTAGRDGNVRVYDLATFKQVMSLRAADIPYSAAFSAQGDLVVAGYSSGTTRVWDVTAGLQLTSLTGNASTVYTARFSATGREVVTASADGTIRVWHGQPREMRYAFTTSFTGGAPNLPNVVYTASYSADGKHILTVDASGYAKVFPTAGRAPAYSVGSRGSFFNSAEFNGDGTEVVTADSGGTVELWRIKPSSPGYTKISSLARLNGPALNAKLSADGSCVVIETDNNTAIVRNVRSDCRLHLNPSEERGFPLKIAVFRPHSNEILTGDYNGQIEVWNGFTGTNQRVLGRPGPAINDLQFNSNGTQFVTASDSGVATVWNADNDHQVLAINACPSPNAASFSPDGHKIVVACGDGGARVFDAATGLQLTVLKAANFGEVNSAVFSPDGKSILTTFDAHGTGGVRVWSSELATRSLSTLERIAEQRVTRSLTAAERQQYLAGISG